MRRGIWLTVLLAILELMLALTASALAEVESPEVEAPAEEVEVEIGLGDLAPEAEDTPDPDGMPSAPVDPSSPALESDESQDGEHAPSEGEEMFDPEEETDGSEEAGIAEEKFVLAVSNAASVNEASASDRILIYNQYGTWSDKPLRTANDNNTMKSSGCHIYAYAHVYQWVMHDKRNTSNGGELLDAFIQKCDYPWGYYYKNQAQKTGLTKEDVAKLYYGPYMKSKGIIEKTANELSNESALVNLFSQGGAVILYIPGHYFCGVNGVYADIDGDNQSELWIHIVDSSCGSTFKRIYNKCYAYGFVGNGRISSQDGSGFMRGDEYWIAYKAFNAADISVKNGYLPTNGSGGSGGSSGGGSTGGGGSTSGGSTGGSVIATYKVITSEGLNVRSGAGTNYTRLTTIWSPTTIAITETTVVSGVTWGKGTTSTGVTGWISLSSSLVEKVDGGPTGGGGTTTPSGSEMSSGYSQTIANGNYLIASASDSRYYLDIEGVAVPAASGTNVSIAGPLTGTPNAFDTWTVTYNGDGFYSIKQNGADVSLDVTGGSVYSGANIQAWGSNGSASQRWAISSHPNGGYRIQAKVSGYSLDITGVNIANGTNVQQYPNNDSNAQAWVFIPYDSQKPAISNVKVSNITSSGYTVSCTVSDNVGVTKVQFPTWYEGQQGGDATWHDGTLSGNTATCYIKVSDHGNKTGLNYHTDIYAWDAAGNVSSTQARYNYIPNPVIAVTSVSLNAGELSLKIGDTFKIQAVVFPLNATNTEVTWTTDNPRVATVTGGTVKAINLGQATITATTVDGKKKASCVVYGTLAIDENLFPDECFRSYVLSEIDTNRDGALSQAEIDKVKSIDLDDYSGICDLSGIELFAGLKDLNCQGCQLFNLEANVLKELEELNCSGNSLSELDVSGLTSLRILNCGDNKLNEIDVSGLTSLERLECWQNLLCTLDVSSCTNLEVLVANENYLATLKLGSLQKLNSLCVSTNVLRTLDVSNCPCIVELTNKGIDVEDCEPGTISKYLEKGGAFWEYDIDDNVEVKIKASSTTDTPTPTPEPLPYVYGDADGDGLIDGFDASLILQFEVGKIGAERLDLAAADVDGSGVVDGFDASLILQYEVGRIASFSAAR